MKKLWNLHGQKLFLIKCCLTKTKLITLANHTGTHNPVNQSNLNLNGVVGWKSGASYLSQSCGMVDPKLTTFFDTHMKAAQLFVISYNYMFRKFVQKINSHFTILIQWNSALQPPCYSINHLLPVAPYGTKATNKHPPVITVLGQVVAVLPIL